MKLIFKVTLAITALLFAIMIPFVYLNVRTIKGLLYEEAAMSADIVSETIIRMTRRQMMENDREGLDQMIREAGSQADIEHISMINKEGDVAFSTGTQMAASSLVKSDLMCATCHNAGKQPLDHTSPMSRSRVFIGEGGKEKLGIAKAIFNDATCYTAPCHYHSSDQRILGVLNTVVSLENMQVQTWQYLKSLILLTLSMLFVTGATLTLLIRRQVTNPIVELLDHTKKIGELEFGTEIISRSRDEIGDLSRSFNDMTRKLERARKELEEWGHTLEHKVAERTMEIMRIQAQLIQSEKLASLGEIVAGIAHELNNPLTGVIVFSSLLEKDEKLSTTQKADVASILHESQRCARIVKGLLEFSRVTSPQKLKASVNTVLDDTLALIGTQSIFHDVNIRKNYLIDLKETLIDTNQIQQVFINILINAGQAMPEGGDLDIFTGMDDNHIVVSIRDTGCGISPEHVTRIFDPFFTTKGNAGTGLGLSVSYGIVESHGGAIEVSSAPSQGTEFTIRLPLTDEI